MIRALVAEDSATARELLVAILTSDPNITVAGVAKDGVEAVEMTIRLRPDLVVMDINMPNMNGFEATKRIMIEAPTPIVVVSAVTDVRDTAMLMNTLRIGAVALLPKPTGLGTPEFEQKVQHLISTVKAMAEVKVVRHRAPSRSNDERDRTRAHEPSSVRLVAIAASTGGPAALARILSELPTTFPVPILIVQHIASGFVEGFATWLNTACALTVKIAAHSEIAEPATVYLAADGRHMGISAGLRIILDDAPAIDGFRPSANYLFDSVARNVSMGSVGIVLTGMGADGATGLHRLSRCGGYTIAEDESTAVVYGMPAAAMRLGGIRESLPLPRIASRLNEIV